MARLILHHYDFSNYSEKIRLVLGLKQLSWGSVIIPAYAPKPDYTPLTAGYRRTPALQIGADVYCDTSLIVDVIDEIAPTPTLYPGADPELIRAHCRVLESWAESSLMRPLALYITGLHADEFPADFHADRARLHGKALPSVAQVKASAVKFRAQVDVQMGRLEALLSAPHRFVIGDLPSLADLALFEAPWFLQTIGGEAALSRDYTNIRKWSEAVAMIGHGVSQPLAASAALSAALAATPKPIAIGAGAALDGFSIGEKVTVSPFDQYSPATGILVALDDERIAIATEHVLTGLVHVHFPRLGYRVSRPRGDDHRAPR